MGEISEQASPKEKHTDASKPMEENVDLWLMGREGGAMWLKCFEVKK